VLCLATAFVSYALPGRSTNAEPTESGREHREKDRVFEEEAEFVAVGSMLAEEHLGEEQGAADQ
jgi:hypothetical protein